VLDAPFPELPDMSDAVLTERLDLGAQTFLIQVSPVRHFDDYGPEWDVVHVWVLREDGIPLVLRDLHPSATREAAFNLWNFLCEQLSAAAALAYGLPADEGSLTNPQLGCWGPRPDMAGPDADDGATALILGVAVDTEEATRPGRHDLFALALRSAVVAALRRWVTESRPRRAVNPRLN
jgi:hypothetical protein